MNYVMSRRCPKLIPCEDNLLEGVGLGYWKKGQPPAVESARHIADSLGYMIAHTLPLYWDGQGCTILSHGLCGEPTNETAKRFRFLALLNISYDEETVVGIRDEAELLLFFHLIQPWLDTVSNPAFQHRKDRETFWDRGRSWDTIKGDEK